MIAFFVAYFPASGVRSRTDGMLSLSGIEGSSLSSSPFGVSGINAARLCFTTDVLHLLGGIYRAHTYPVRCVQAFINDTFSIFVVDIKC